MPWPRGSEAGITLIEALVAFALLTLVMTMAFPVLTRGSVGSAKRLDRLHASEFAMSLMEEYRVRGEAVPLSGTDISGWSWTISETVVHPDGPTSLDGLMVLVEVKLAVWHPERPESQQIFHTLAARSR
ncbi:type II secretion system protein [Gemmobacter nectariphilus]|uniref:type II secretion system protein n=1 Tax=Gemmobacter nectariphilus TaxID=220343 RepID=UPI00048478C7|nr:type II secretion system protein [Gemmobacter nectariphilus]